MAKEKIDWKSGIAVNTSFKDKEIAKLWDTRAKAAKAFGEANDAFQAAFVAKCRTLPVSHELHLNADEKFAFGTRFGGLKVVAVPVTADTKQSPDAVDL